MKSRSKVSNVKSKILSILKKYINLINSKYLPVWLARRKRIFFSITIDILIFTFANLIFQAIVPYLKILFFWIVTSYMFNRYDIGKFKNIDILKNKEKMIKDGITSAVLTILFYVFLTKFISKDILLINSFYFLISISLISFLLQYTYRKLIYKYEISNSNLVFYGPDELFNEIKYYLNENKLSIKINQINSIDDIEKEKLNINGIIIEEVNNENLKKINKIKLKSKNKIEILTTLDWFEIFLEKIPSLLLTNELLMKRNYFKITSKRELKLKRMGDILFSIMLLITTSPIIIIAAIAIYIEDRGPIFYFQNRSGVLLKKIRIFKLRSMKIDSEKDGMQWSGRNDNRITNVGKFLRKTRIDELPQLVSVIKGDMSLIGPRPERPEIDKILMGKIPFYDIRYSIRPGLSGWAQVNYPYGSSIRDSEEKLSFDLYYLANFSFLLDLVIMFETIKLIFHREGAISKH